VTLSRDGDTVAADAGGAVTLTTPEGCTLTATAPFELHLSAVRCSDGRIRLTVAPSRPRAGRSTRLRIRTTTLAGGRTVPVAGAQVRVRERRVRTGADGRVRVVVSLARHRRNLKVAAGKPGLRSARTTLRLLPPARR
jgi:hypothetical protein